MEYFDQICAFLYAIYIYVCDLIWATAAPSTIMSSKDDNAETGQCASSIICMKKTTPTKRRSISLPESSVNLGSEESSDATCDSDILDSSAIDDNPVSRSGPKPERDKLFKWLSPQKFLKSLKHPKSSKKLSSRPICSSDLHIDPSKFSQSISPIQAEQVDSKHLKSKVERIDYANLSEEKIIPSFLGSRTCYDVMPTSGKVVVLSVELLVKNAFEALVSNELRAAPLWDLSVFSFVGMLTISDFISVLRYYYSNAPDDIKDIESQSIATWRRINNVSKPVVKINGMDNLAQATKLLIEEGVHRVPVLDENRQSVLFILTRKRLLHYLYKNIVEKFGKTIVKTPSFLTKSIHELGVGTFSDIAEVTYNTKVIEALDLFVQRRVSALPIVDEDNVLLDIFAKFDVFALAKEQTYHNLDMTIYEAIDKGKVHEDVYGCKLSDTLGSVIETIVKSKAHRLVVIDEKKTVIGMVSLSDILKFLVVQPLNKMGESSNQPSDTIEEAPEGAVGGGETDDSVFLEPKLKPTEDSGAEESEVDTTRACSETEEEKSEDAKPKENSVEPEG